MGQAKQRKALMGKDYGKKPNHWKSQPQNQPYEIWVEPGKTIQPEEIAQAYPYPVQFKLEPLEKMLEELQEEGADLALITWLTKSYPYQVEENKKDIACWNRMASLVNRTKQKEIQLLFQGVLSHAGKDDFTKEGWEKMKQAGEEIVAQYPSNHWGIMQSILTNLIPPSLQRCVEQAWHGIGDWRA